MEWEESSNVAAGPGGKGMDKRAKEAEKKKRKKVRIAKLCVS